MAEESREKDKKILIEILINMEGRLSLIVHQRPDVPGMPHFRREFMEFFPGPWDQVAAHFKLSRAMIEKDEVDWEYVEGIATTGNPREGRKDSLTKHSGGMLPAGSLRSRIAFLEASQKPFHRLKR